VLWLTVYVCHEHVRDLGVYHDSRLKYDQQVSLIVHKAYKRAVLILKCFHSRNSEVLKLAFCVFVRPLLEFASQVWPPHYKYLIDKVESVQRFFTRTILGIKDATDDKNRKPQPTGSLYILNVR